jgi:hypothetical protein
MGISESMPSRPTPRRMNGITVVCRGAHTVRYFDFVNWRAPATGFWPTGTTRAPSRGLRARGLAKLKEQNVQPESGKNRWTTVVLDNGHRVHRSA